MMKFYVGETVRLKTGKSLMKIMAIDYKTKYVKGKPDMLGYFVRAAYISTLRAAPSLNAQNNKDLWEDWRYEDDYVSVGYQYKTKEEPKMSNALYQTKEVPPRFGTKIAVNSAGKFVLEMKGSGDVAAFSEEEIEEVLPHTMKVKCIYLGGQKCEQHFEVSPNSFKIGDTLLSVSDDSGLLFLIVVDLNTNKKDSKKLCGKFRKITTEELSFQSEK